MREAHGFGLWKEIRKDKELVKYRIAFLMGDETMVKFWKDR